MSRPAPERSSSFARSFFQGSEADGLGDGMDTEAPVAQTNGEAPGPGMGMRRQRSRRRMSGRNSRSGGEMAVAAAAAAAIQYEEGEPTPSMPQQQRLSNASADGSINVPPPVTNRDGNSSWYNDAMAQSGNEDLSAILGQVQDDAAGASQPRSDEDEVLEQYKIMAQFEASLRVTDNTGFDMAEYEKRRKLQPEPEPMEYYTGAKKPKPRLPEPRPIHSANGVSASTKPEEPTLPPLRPNRRFLDLTRERTVPEFVTGVELRGQHHLAPHEFAVRCLGCKARLRANIMAILVSCPNCNTVSPASSTRR